MGWSTPGQSAAPAWDDTQIDLPGLTGQDPSTTPDGQVTFIVSNQSLYYYDSTSTATPDGSAVLNPDAIIPPAPGRWIRIIAEDAQDAIAAPTRADKQLNPLPVTVDGGDTGLTLSIDPAGTYVSVRVNGVDAHLAQGESERTTADCYFSRDGGLTAVDLADLAPGDKCFWNALVSYPLGIADEIDFEYDILLNVVAPPPSQEARVKISSNDTTSEFLLTKLQAGTNISFAEIADGGNERVQISATGGASGEANTISGVGTAGANLVAGKVGVDLQVRKLNAASPKITVAADVGNQKVDIDVVESQVAHQNLGGAGGNTHAQIDTHLASIVNPHGVTAAQVLAAPASHVGSGGAEHLPAGAIAGFMAAADKTKLDGIAAGAQPNDGKVVISSNDTTPGLLLAKLVAGTNITLTEQNDGANETIKIDASGGGGTDDVAAICMSLCA